MSSILAVIGVRLGLAVFLACFGVLTAEAYLLWQQVEEQEALERHAVLSVLPDDWVWHSKESGLPGDEVTHLLLSHDGTVWVNTDNGIASFKGNRWHYYRDFSERLFYRSAARFILDRHGLPWVVGTPANHSLITSAISDAGLAKFTGTDFEVVKKGYFNDITSCPSGEVWVAPRWDEYVLRFDGTGFEEVSVEGQLDVGFGFRAIYCDTADRLWIFAGDSFGWREQSGFVVFTENNAEFVGYPWSREYLVGEDLSGGLWVVTEGAEVGVFRSRHWTTYDSVSQAVEGEYSFIVSTGDNTAFWTVGPKREVLLGSHFFDGRDWYVLDPFRDIAGLAAYDPLVMPDGSIWIPTTKGIIAVPSWESLRARATVSSPPVVGQ